MVIEKRCTKCKIIKPVTEFYRNCRSKDGYAWNCKQCSKASSLYDKELQQHANMLMAFRTLKRDIKRSALFKEG